MNDSLYIAWKYICSEKTRTATLVTCVTLIIFLPVHGTVVVNIPHFTFKKRELEIFQIPSTGRFQFFFPVFLNQVFPPNTLAQSPPCLGAKTSCLMTSAEKALRTPW